MSNNAEIQPMFIRHSSGLVREFSTYDVFVFNTLAYAMGLVVVATPSFLGGLYPNANIYAVLTFGVLLSVCNGLTYGLFSAAMPRSGGDYIFIGRTLRPWVGFTASWGFTWSQFLGLGVYAGWCVSDALSPGITILGHTAGPPTLVGWGKDILSPPLLFLIGSLLLAAVAVISVFGMRTLKLLLNSLFIIALLGTFAMLYVFVFSSQGQFIERFDAFMSQNASMPDAYNSILKLATQHGLAPGQPTDLWSAVLALPVGYWVFIGFTYSVYVGGEVKEPQRSQVVGILGALAFGYIMYMLILGRYYAVVGRDFNNAVAIIKDLPDTPLVANGSPAFSACLLTDSLPLQLLISISTFLWYFLMLFVMAQVCVRNLFAWAFDGIMPSWLTVVSSRYASPWPATVVAVLLSEAFLAFHAFLGMAFINYIALFSICFLVAGVAAIVFPYRRRDLFDRSPPLVRRTFLGIPLITLAGVGNVVLFAIVLYSALTNAGVSGVQGYLPTVLLLTIYGSGAALYGVISLRRRGRASLDLLYEALPPE